LALTCLDPFGRLVFGAERRWAEHIDARHPEVNRFVAAVIGAVTDPDEIRRDVDRANRESYYRFGVLPDPHDNAYLKVCVSFGAEGPLGWESVGAVVTAFRVAKPKREESLIWTRPSRSLRP
jgi:hypothetical protein